LHPDKTTIFAIGHLAFTILANFSTYSYDPVVETLAVPYILSNRGTTGAGTSIG